MHHLQVGIPVTRSFALTFDYRCPFARLVHDHVVEGLRAGANWDVTFLPFCLGQAHVEEGQPDIWEIPQADSGLLALQLAISIRDNQPDAFLDFHQAMFNHRHNGGGSLKDRTGPSSRRHQGRAHEVRPQPQRVGHPHVCCRRQRHLRASSRPFPWRSAGCHPHHRAHPRRHRVANPQRIQAHQHPHVAHVGWSDG